jgi:transposase
VDGSKTETAIVADWINGSTIRELADQYGKSKSKIGQIVAAHVPAHVRRQIIAKRSRPSLVRETLAALTGDQIIELNRTCSSMEQIAHRLGVASISVYDEYAVWLERRFEPCGLVARQQRPQEDRRDIVVAAVRQAVADTIGPLTPSQYKIHPVAQTVSLPTVYRVIRQAGWSWGDLVVAAGGVRPASSHGRTRSVTIEAAVAAINAYLDWEQGRPTVNGYVTWRASQPAGGCPSYSSIVTVLEVRSWREVVQRCRLTGPGFGRVRGDAG